VSNNIHVNWNAKNPSGWPEIVYGNLERFSCLLLLRLSDTLCEMLALPYARSPRQVAPENVHALITCFAFDMLDLQVWVPFLKDVKAKLLKPDSIHFFQATK
jgi:hypothetical protein